MKIDYCFGIYYFTDKENGQVVYIGKDSHIDKNLRYKQHYQLSKYNSQPINQILQSNPSRYEYNVYCHVSDIDELNQLEFDLINLYRPKFNFKHGGDGGISFEKRNLNNFVYSVVKGGKGKDSNHTQQYCICDRYNKHLIQSIDYDYLKDIANKLNSGELDEQSIPQKPFEYTIAKMGQSKGKQTYCILGKSGQSLVKSIDFDKLKLVATALNDKIIPEDTVKYTRGINKILGLIEYENTE